MSAADLELVNVMNVSVSAAQTGIGNYNTSNVALFTHEVPANSFGTLGYALYLGAAGPLTDFGSASITAQMAANIFSQSPNILSGGGYLAVITLIAAVQTFALSSVATQGTFVLNYGALATAAINWNDTAAQIQSKLRALAGLGSVTVTGSIASQSLVITMAGVYGNPALLTISSAGTFENVSNAAVTFTGTITTAGETIDAAVARTKDVVQFFAHMATVIAPQADVTACAAVTQALNKIGVVVSRTSADVSPGGTLDLLRSGSFSQTRGLYYGGATDLSALLFMAAYVGRGFSTNFSGSNTCQTMHLKALPGVQPDPTMTQAILTLCQTAGADCYVSIQGIPMTFTSGSNKFFDQVYNLQAFVGSIQVAGFNFLAQSSTKVPQTESAMTAFKGAYRKVCEQYVANGYLAPGSWTLPNTFGDPETFNSNIVQKGYFIFSQPITQQNTADRAARKAPLCQIATKEAGAMHSGAVLINVNS